jgi:lipid-A-disaccharide synthase-like uncharacterized protein
MYKRNRLKSLSLLPDVLNNKSNRWLRIQVFVLILEVTVKQSDARTTLLKPACRAKTGERPLHSYSIRVLVQWFYEKPDGAPRWYPWWSRITAHMYKRNRLKSLSLIPDVLNNKSNRWLRIQVFALILEMTVKQSDASTTLLKPAWAKTGEHALHSYSIRVLVQWFYEKPDGPQDNIHGDHESQPRHQVFLELHRRRRSHHTRTLTPMNTRRQTLSYDHLRSTEHDRSGDSRSHQHWCLVVEGNVAYHLKHNTGKSRNKSRKRCEHQDLNRGG